MEEKNVLWFKANLAPKLENYKLNYKFFDEGDFGTFGALNQIEFNSEKIGGNIDFWGLGWLGIFVWDHKKEEELLNVLVEPDNEEKQIEAFRKLEELLF